ncbi:MobQ family relaxase [Mediterraneibacter gnavus]|uniref:MobQ family relaxase n=1 Tax=Mediterraneibacter gnavus TaxID=33038 RepID=UPI00232F2010|nr:MobQ family relaxase [Mediterraneibacter gnavus]MDB8711109.1 MobA/MobL family protein [Mediterraneibacter gnavus]MDB8714451.1 MobA/MobL family protein [Mediterraneibacter gnavus]
MAIYHMQAKVVSRGSGRSAVAASAYMSCSCMYNDYDGIQHDYTRKHGLIYQEVMLPPMAPPEWKNREQLWNAVEAAEKTKDSRLAREFVVALPIELDKDSNLSLLQNFIQKNFVDMGMCADFAIHDTDGHNPHAHILLTVRPLNENGTWQYKTEKEYLCVKDGEEKGFTASEFKDAQKEGWEKQYRYKAGKKKVYLTPSAAQEKGYERIDKHPKSTRYGRQNPISEQWNSEEQLCLWRANWADAVNKMLALNQINAAIDHRSFAAQGITEQPTIHEGYIAQNMEKKGMIADRCKINRQIRADNRILRDLKAQIKKLAQAVEKSIPVIAETLEVIRNHMIFTQYHLLHNEMQKEVIHDWMQHFRPILNQYDTIKKKLKAKVAEKKELHVQKNKTSILNPLQHIKLNQQLTTITEEIEELKSAKEQLLFQAECSTEKDMASLSRKYDQMDKNLDILDSQDMTLKGQLEKDAVAFQEEKLQPKPEQYTELLDTRIQIRPTFREKLIEQLKDTFGKSYDYHYRDIAAHEVDDLNMEDPYSFSHRTWELEYQRKQELQKKHPVQSRQKSHNTEL